MTVEVTWDTGVIFGVLKATREYVIADVPAESFEPTDESEFEIDDADYEIEEPE